MATASECIRKIILENILGRKLVMVGKFDSLERFLAGYDIFPEIYVSLNKESNNVFSVEDISIIKHRNNELYILFPYEINEETKKLMEEYGYENIRDYCSMQKMHKKIAQVRDYADAFNNKCNYLPPNINITFMGINSKVSIAEGVKAHGIVEIIMYDNSTLFIDEETEIGGVLRLDIGGEVSIGRECRGRFKFVYAGYKSKVSIGNYTTFTGSAELSCHNGKIEIGEDCMLAASCTFMCADGHAIYDVNSGMHLNNVKEKNQIVLKDHVWGGINSLILSKTIIEEGSIVGAGSLVKGEYPNNCIIAGNPASRKKNDIFWCRNLEGNIKESEKKYFNKTILKSENKKIDEGAIDEECSSNTYKVE